MGGASIYHIIILIAGVLGIFRGWRCGFLGQTGGLLGILFGIVFCRLFARDGAEIIEGMLPSIAGLFASDFIYMSLSTAAIFITVYLGFRLLSSIFRRILCGLRLGAINSLAGSALCLFKYMLMISLVYNVILAIFPGCALMRECKAGDGNMVEVVMELAPALLNTYSPCDLALKYQLKEAEAISANITGTHLVISMTGCTDARLQSYSDYATSKRFACRNQWQGDS